MKKLIALLLLVGCNPPSPAPVAIDPDGAVTVRVTRVLDGDTFAFEDADGEEQVVRLTGVDCPETRGDGGQPFGKEAKAFVEQLCLDREVQLVQTGRHFDRWLAYAYVDGEFVQHLLLREGLAWHADRYSSSREMERLEAEARNASSGLWSRGSALPPWEWRGGQR